MKSSLKRTVGKTAVKYGTIAAVTYGILANYPTDDGVLGDTIKQELDKQIESIKVPCNYHPYCRQLTQRETTYAKQFFGDTLPYEKIEIYTPWPYERTLNETISKFTGDYTIAEYRISDNSLHFYRTPAENDNDFLLVARDTTQHSKQAAYVLIHELTHIWQRETMGRSGVEKKAANDITTLKNKLKENYKHIHLYDYATPFTKPFKDYGIEQQAEIMETIAKHKDNVRILGMGLNIANIKVDWGAATCDAYKAHVELASKNIPVQISKKEQEICARYELTPDG